ncbi:MAG: immunoglobulin-like domain-containing protein [Lachnospiraceae bacterium]
MLTLKKKIIAAIAVLLVLASFYLAGTGFRKRTDVFLADFSISEDGTEMTFTAGIASSMGYIRGFKDNGGGLKPHYLTFYSTFGGSNSSFGAKQDFKLELDPEDTEIYFARPDQGYELVLVKDAETGEWRRPDAAETGKTKAENSTENKDNAGESNQMTADDTVEYNGKKYLKSELSEATLNWLALSEQERLLSSYMPPEFVTLQQDWGITLEAEDITPTGLTIRCTQSEGNPTGELNTGSWYIVENWTQENGWKEVDYVIKDNIGWTMEAWLIPENSTSEWEVDWEWLYGKLPVGKYRIGKEIMDFRETGDYDKEVYYAEFEITEEMVE